MESEFYDLRTRASKGDGDHGEIVLDVYKACMTRIRTVIANLLASDLVLTAMRSQHRRDRADRYSDSVTVQAFCRASAIPEPARCGTALKLLASRKFGMRCRM